MHLNFGKTLLPGTVLALDGIVIETRKPYHHEVNDNINGNYNRKGYFGMIAISACDVWCRFVYSNLEWNGTTNDSVAIRFIELFDKLESGSIPDNLHIVADDAFCATHKQILTHIPN